MVHLLSYHYRYKIERVIIIMFIQIRISRGPYRTQRWTRNASGSKAATWRHGLLVANRQPNGASAHRRRRVIYSRARPRSFLPRRPRTACERDPTRPNRTVRVTGPHRPAPCFRKSPPPVGQVRPSAINNAYQ